VTEAARDALRAAGLVEVMTLPFASAADHDRIGLAADDPRRRMVRVLNPLTEEESGLQTTLVPALLGVLRSNRSRQLEEVQAFEIARVFTPRPAGDLPEERLELAAVLTTPAEGLWRDPQRVPVFFAAKGVAEQVLAGAAVAARFAPGAGEPWLHPGAGACIEVDGRAVGAVGELHPETAARYEIDGPCALLTLDLGALADAPSVSPRYREVSRQPSVRRDLAVLLPREEAAGRVLEAIRTAAGPHLVSARVFDRYEGRGVPEGRVSLAFRLVFQRPDRTLTDAEVARATERVVSVLADRFRGELRQGAGGAGG
jgi:phenylalanyl-tRNA synthetase beta chain